MLPAIARTIGLYLALGAAFVVVAVFVHRRGGRARLILLWLAVSVLYGYIRYRLLCAQPLTCDVIGPGWAFRYFIRNAPVYAAKGAVIFGAPAITLAMLRRRRSNASLGLQEIALGALAALAGWFFSSLVVGALRLPAY